MTPELALGIGNLVALAVTVATAILMFRSNRRKVNAEAQQAEAGAAASLVNAASGFVDDLSCEVKRLQDRITILEENGIKREEVVEQLRKDLAAAGQRVAALEALSEEQARLIERLRADLQDAEVRIKVLEQENERLQQENERLRSVQDEDAQ